MFKMFSRRGVLGALVTMLASSFAFTASAAAKEPVILVIDQSRLIATSKAGKSIASQLETIGKSENTKLEAEITKVSKEGESLKAEQAKLSKEDFAKKAREFAIKQQRVACMREIKVRELQIAEQRAMGKISETLAPILKSMVEKKGATILLDRSAVMYVNPEADITDDVLKELDAKLATVKVNKVDLEAEVKAAQAAQAQAKK